MTEIHSAPTRHPRSTGPGRAVRLRREAAGRQQAVRDRRRQSGEPDPGLLDRVVVDALRSVLLRCPDSLLLPIEPSLVLSLAREHLLLRSKRAHEIDPDAPVYNGAAVAEALRRRLLEPPKRPIRLR